MEIYRLNASAPDNNSISQANVDFYARLFPSANVNIPISFLQNANQRAYDVGIEWQYSLYEQTEKRWIRYVLNRTGVTQDLDEMEEIYEQDEDDMDGIGRVNGENMVQNRVQEIRDGLGTMDELRDGMNGFETMEVVDFGTEKGFPGMEKDINRKIDGRQPKRISGLLQIARYLFAKMDVKGIHGMWMFHLRKPWQNQYGYHHRGILTAPLEDYDENMFWKIIQVLPHAILLNHSSIVFGKNKVSAVLGFNSITKSLSSKLHLRRKYYLPGIRTPLFISGSLYNFQSPYQSYVVGTSLRGYRLRFKNAGVQKAVIFSKQGWFSLFSNNTREYLMNQWQAYKRKDYRIPYIPPPINAYPMPPPKGSESDVIIGSYYRLLSFFRQIYIQTMAILRYIWLVQIRRSTIATIWTWRNMKSFFANRIFEQLFELSNGFYTKTSAEFIWKSNRPTLVDRLVTQNKFPFKSFPYLSWIKDYLYGIRCPIEWHWGCDVFRIWLFVDMLTEWAPRSNFWFHSHSVTIAITIFDIYTLMSHTFSLQHIYTIFVRLFVYIRVGMWVFIQRIKSGNVQIPIWTYISKITRIV